MKMPLERRSVTHKFKIGEEKGYITVGLFENGQPGEIFITMAKQDSTERGFCDAFAIAVSFCLQAGVPLKYLVEKFKYMRFAPNGYTNNKKIPLAKSVVDYIFQWLEMKFLSEDNVVQNNPG